MSWMWPTVIKAIDLHCAIIFEPPCGNAPTKDAALHELLQTTADCQPRGESLGLRRKERYVNDPLRHTPIRPTFCLSEKLFGSVNRTNNCGFVRSAEVDLL